MTHKTNIKPTVAELNEILLSYGHPEIRVPAASTLRLNENTPPWVAYIDLIFTDVTEADITTPTDWFKRVIDRVDALLDKLRRVGWVRVNGTRLTLGNEFDRPTCTLDQKLVSLGETYNMTAKLEFEVVPISGELVG